MGRRYNPKSRYPFLDNGFSYIDWIPDGCCSLRLVFDLQTSWRQHKLDPTQNVVNQDS